MVPKRFHLTRTLRYEMQGQDVKLMQYWLNIVNVVYSFSDTYDSIPENGKFTMFMTRVFLDQFQKWLGSDDEGNVDESYITYCYDPSTHYFLCNYVNMALESIGSRERWTI